MYQKHAFSITASYLRFVLLFYGLHLMHSNMYLQKINIVIVSDVKTPNRCMCDSLQNKLTILTTKKRKCGGTSEKFII